MKRILWILLVAVFLTALIPSAYAEESSDFAIDERTVFGDMKRSWLQGYDATVVYDTFVLTLPVSSERAQGKVQVELIPADEAISPSRLRP